MDQRACSSIFLVVSHVAKDVFASDFYDLLAWSSHFTNTDDIPFLFQSFSHDLLDSTVYTKSTNPVPLPPGAT